MEYEFMKIKHSSLLRSVSVFSLMTFISRIFGFIRDVVIASVFGASYLTDAFWVAFKIPNFMRRLVAEGAFTQAFVPILSEYQKNYSKDEIKVFTGKVGGTLAGATFLISVIGICCAPILVYVFAPGFASLENPERYVYATDFLRVTFPYLFFIALTAFYGAILNSYGYYAAPAFSPVLLNLSMIVGALYISKFFTVRIWGLVLGVSIAGLLQFTFLWLLMYSKGLISKFKLKMNDPGVLKVLGAMVPALLGVSVAQLNLMVDTIFASFLM
ncbi:MAG: murein biosynthesis integral membrane protein MurJ, partial [Legionellales bacterium]|nr:murein biosynthesis integral membrane protein MurJ [Legionellales bacterium]